MAKARARRSGNVINYIPATAITAGTMVPLGDFGVGFCEHDAAAGEATTLNVFDIHEAPCKASDDIARFAKLYLDEEEQELTLTATDNVYAGYAESAAGVGVTTVYVKPGGVGPQGPQGEQGEPGV